MAITAITADFGCWKPLWLQGPRKALLRWEHSTQSAVLSGESGQNTWPSSMKWSHLLPCSLRLPVRSNVVPILQFCLLLHDVFAPGSTLVRPSSPPFPPGFLLRCWCTDWLPWYSMTCMQISQDGSFSHVTDISSGFWQKFARSTGKLYCFPLPVFFGCIRTENSRPFAIKETEKWGKKLTISDHIW